MQGFLVGLCIALVALLGGCSWYVLSRLGARADSLDGRLRSLEQLPTRIDARSEHVEGQISALEERVNSVLEKFTDFSERLTVVEERHAST